jgi:hypothetical protein
MGAIDDFLRAARKFNVSVVLATQHLDLPPALRASIFSNCTRFFAFASSASDAAFLAKEFGGVEGPLVAEMLPELKTGQALVKVRGNSVVLLRVRPAGPKPTPHEIADGLAPCLRAGMSREQVDKDIEQRRRYFLAGDKRDGQDSADASSLSEGELPEGYEGF